MFLLYSAVCIYGSIIVSLWSLYSCPLDPTVRFHHNDDNKGLQRFSVETFQFVNSPDPFVYIYYKVTDINWRCNYPRKNLLNMFSAEVKLTKDWPQAIDYWQSWPLILEWKLNLGFELVQEWIHFVIIFFSILYWHFNLFLYILWTCNLFEWLEYYFRKLNATLCWLYVSINSYILHVTCFKHEE